MSSLCCNSKQGYRNIRTDHEQKFSSFLSWFGHNTDGVGAEPISDGGPPSFIIQVVKQVRYAYPPPAVVEGAYFSMEINFGRILSKRFFASPSGDGAQGFHKVNEAFTIEHNFQKLNTYKNYKCTPHNMFFELNVYSHDQRNRHHWRSNVARPASEIDIELH